MYLEMAPVMQLYNVFRNRWCGAYWASKGLRVIPTVNWGGESTFDFCFEGIEKGSTVAVSTYMASESEHHEAQKEWFMAGYREMLRRIEPERIICYNTPFPEMEGNIVYVDYDRSSWRYMSYERKRVDEDLECYKIGCTSHPTYDTMDAYMIGKGGGSAYGGEWKPSPNKPDDQRFLGNPGETKVTTKSDGTKYETKIGPNGKATYERHHTNHSPNGQHSNPHDHKINWETPRQGMPNLEPAINYFDGDVPSFDTLGGPSMTDSNSIIFANNTPESDRFVTISDFKDCMIRGGEVRFCWGGITYCCFGCLIPKGGSEAKMFIAQSGPAAESRWTEKWCDNADEVLEYLVGHDRLRDVITQVTVIERTI